jgi:hypothetical protein
MANTFELIASSTVGSGGAASIDFTSIPSTFTDICVKLSLRSNSTTSNTGQYDVLLYRLNSSTSGYTAKYISGNGAAAESNSNTTATSASAGGTWGRVANGGVVNSLATASTFSNVELYIPNYAGSNNKSVSLDSVTEQNATNAIAELDAGLWSNTAAITSVSFALLVGTLFTQYSTAYLYGVKNA